MKTENLTPYEIQTRKKMHTIVTLARLVASGHICDIPLDAKKEHVLMFSRRVCCKFLIRNNTIYHLETSNIHIFIGPSACDVTLNNSKTAQYP